jgi:cytochrome c oxidase assembly factor CtaG
MTWRGAGLVLGLALIWIAVAWPRQLGGEHLLTVHMVRHLLLMSVAPPLVWLARPIKRLGIPLGHPVVCWVAATTVLVAWHVPALLTLSMSSRAWQAIEQLSFLAGGLLFWWPVVQPWPASAAEPRWSMVLYLFLATLPCDALSGFLVFSERIVYALPASTHAHAGLSALDDQQLAGALMWTVVTIVYVVAGVIVATQSVGGPTLNASSWHHPTQEAAHQ